VLLSGRNEAEAEKAERVVMTSGLEWTVVRCAFFAQNFNEGAWLDEVLAGAVSLPVDQAQEPFVDVDDIADVVVAALTDDRHCRPALRADGSAPARLPRCRGGDRRGRRPGHQLRVDVDR
jgi:uncharacterized protein YbjT (DUF2867 family)